MKPLLVWSLFLYFINEVQPGSATGELFPLTSRNVSKLKKMYSFCEESLILSTMKFEAVPNFTTNL